MIWLVPPVIRGALKSIYTRGITAEEFERQYAERAGWSLEFLRQHRTVRACECDYESCEGWQMVSHEAAAEIDDPEQPWAR